MARTKEFDPDEVLQRAMDRFWTYGFEATSIQDLVEHTGINRGSLYGTYRDKKALFRDALACYMDRVVGHFVDVLAHSPKGLDAIAQVFYSLTEAARHDPEKRGCFLTNTAVGLVPENRELRAQVGKYFRRVEKAFETALERARSAGEIDPDADVRALARYLTSSIQGLLVMRKVTSDVETLSDIARITLSMLR